MFVIVMKAGDDAHVLQISRAHEGPGKTQIHYKFVKRLVSPSSPKELAMYWCSGDSRMVERSTRSHCLASRISQANVSEGLCFSLFLSECSVYKALT